MKNRIQMVCKLLTFVVICSFISCGLGGIVSAQDQVAKDTPATAYTKHRQAFVSKQKEANLDFKKKNELLEKDIRSIQEDNVRQNSEIRKLESDIAIIESQTNSLEELQMNSSVVLFPILAGALMMPSFMTDVISNLLYIFLIITIINVFIYIFRKKKILFAKYKIALIVLLIFLISSIASPLLADDRDQQDQISDQLTAVEKILSLSEYERFIDILENRKEQHLTLPNLQSGNPLFKVYTQLEIDTPEYWSTLAALYTHEGKNGKALNSVKQLIHKTRFSHSTIHHEMIINCIKYLIEQNQHELINAVVESLTETGMNTSVYLSLANILQENGLNVSSEKILSFAIEQAESVDALIQLSGFLIKAGEIEKGDEGIEKALEIANSFEDILLIADIAITRNKDAITKMLIDKSLIISANSEQLFRIVDMLQSNGQKEEAILLIGEMISRNTLDSQHSIEQQIDLIDGALQRGFIVQATKATELLYFQFGEDAANTQFKLNNIPKASNDLPNPDHLTLSQFYGLINEDQNLMDKAEDIYMQSLMVSLSNILKSNGYKLPDSMNDYYLLGRVWFTENKIDMLARLDAVYSVIEERSVKEQQLLHDRQLEEKKQVLLKLQEQQQELGKTISEKKLQSSITTKKMIFQGLSTISSIAFILATIIGCGIISFQYCMKLSLGKTFGFFTKFNESIGWVYIMTIISLIPGIMCIIVAQFFQIFQHNQENTQRISRILLASTNEKQESQS